MPRSDTSAALFARPSPEIVADFPDRGFQWLLTTHSTVVTLLRLLDAPLTGELDFSAIQPVSRTAFPPDLRKAENDALYLIHFRREVEQPRPRTPLLVLVEHKGASGYYTPLQHLQYLTAHWVGQRQHALLPGRIPTERLPPAVVIRIYTGTRPWKTPRRLSDLMGGPERLRAPGVPWIELDLDLVRFPAEALRDLASPIGWALVLMQADRKGKRAYRCILYDVLSGLSQTARTAPAETLRVAWFVVLHLFHRRSTAEYDALAPIVFDWTRNTLPEANTEVDHMVQTMADVVRERGIQIGEQRGIQIGEQRGIGWMQELVLQGIRDKFGTAGPGTEEAIREMRTREALQTALQAMMAAGSEDDFLARLAADHNGGITG